MPYKLRKAPRRELYWVIAEDGSKMSKDPIPRQRAEKQMKALYIAMRQKREIKGGMCFGRCYRMTAQQKRDAGDEGLKHMMKMWAEGTNRYDEMWADTMAELAMKYPYTTEDQIEEVTNTALKLFKEEVEFIMGRLEQRRRADEAMRVAAAEAAEEQRRDILNENSRIRAFNRATIKEGNANTKRDIEKMRYRR